MPAGIAFFGKEFALAEYIFDRALPYIGAKAPGGLGENKNVKTNLAGNIIGAWTILAIPILLRIGGAKVFFSGVPDSLLDGFGLWTCPI